MSSENGSRAVTALRRTQRDLMALAALPAVWRELSSRELATHLSGALFGMLRVEFVYIRLARDVADDRDGVLRARSPSPPTDATRRIEAVLAALPEDPLHVVPRVLANPFGNGTFRVVKLPIAWSSGEWSLFAAGSDPDFPTPEEWLVLGFGANQAALTLDRNRALHGLQESEARLREHVAALRQSKEAAELANRTKDDFLANVSHEIRTPMNAILGMTELALESPSSLEQASFLRTAQSAADSLLSLIDGLLDFSRIAAGRVELDRSEFSLRHAVTSVVRALAATGQEKGLEILCDVSNDVPDFLVGDPGRFRQILTNLIGNAIKFTSAGEVVVSVSLSKTLAPAGETAIEFAVRDTGIGIPQPKHAVIFEAFTQEDSSTTRKYGGTGLGLTIAARLAVLMDGAITVTSEPGRGSTFVLTARFGLRVSPAEATLASRALPGIRVLVVEPNQTSRAMIASWLSRWRTETTLVADCGAAARSLAADAGSGSTHHVVLVDARVLDASSAGRAFETALLHHGDRGPAVLFMTARPAERRAGSVNECIRKPIVEDELFERLVRLVNREPAPPVRPLARAAELPAPSSRALTVLVADGDAFNASLLCELLRKRGHAPAIATHGDDVVRLLAEGPFELLVIDLHQPGVGGLDTVERVREREQAGDRLPIIALAARERPEDRKRCFAAGVDSLLIKPLDGAALWAALERHLPQRAP